MIKDKIERTDVLLSAQRAMWGEIFPSLRSITVEWSEDCIYVYGYLDGEPSDDDIESISCIATEIVADFRGIDIEFEVIRCDYPIPISDSRTIVYLRRE